MPFPANTATLRDTWETVQRTARDLKKYLQDFNTQSLAGPLSANAVIGVMNALIIAKTQNTAAAGVGGLAAYAQEQVNDPTLNVAAEFTSMNDAITLAINWIVANFPANGGYIQKDTLSATGVAVRSFTTAELAGLRTQLSSVIATIS